MAPSDVQTHTPSRPDCVRPRSRLCRWWHAPPHIARSALMLSCSRTTDGTAVACKRDGQGGFFLSRLAALRWSGKAGSLRRLAMLRRAADLKCRSPRCAGLPPPSLPGSCGARCRPRRPFFGRALPAPANPSLIARALSLVRDKRRPRPSSILVCVPLPLRITRVDLCQLRLCSRSAAMREDCSSMLYGHITSC